MPWQKGCAWTGRSVPVEVRAREVSAGNGLIVAVRDLTERRQKEQSLSLLFHRNPAPVWVSSPEGRMLAVNPAALPSTAMMRPPS